MVPEVVALSKTGQMEQAVWLYKKSRTNNKGSKANQDIGG